MKKLFLAILCVGFASFLSAQACQPNDTVTTLIYPAPLNPSNPGGGINKVACIGMPYDFTFTVNVPDTFNIPLAGSTFSVPLDSAKLQPTGSIINMPIGLDYECNPSNCTYLPLTKGCALMSGTPTPANQPGVYSMAITFTAYLKVFGAPFETDYTYPDTTQTDDRYYLTVLANNNPACVSGLFSTPKEAGSLKIAPNPANDMAFAMADLDKGGSYQMQVFNATGQMVISKTVEMLRGDNLLEIPVADWAEGTYWLRLSDGQKEVKRSFIVSH